MKKIFSIISMVVFIFSAAIAQQEVVTAQSGTTQTSTTSVSEKLVSKKGISILPEKGEFAIGIGADPFLSFLGKLLSTSGSTSPSVQYGNGFSGTQAIYGKYMLENNKAIRVRLGIVNTKNTALYPVEQSSLTPVSTEKQYVNDEVATLTKSYVLSVGIEKTRGNSRVQGKYGAEVFVNFAKSEFNVQYGNPINVDFNSPAVGYGSYTSDGQRVIEDNLSQTLNIGARAFVGVEYFVLPKLSLGGEFGYSLYYGKSGVREVISEYWDSATSSVKTVSAQSRNNSLKFVGLTTDNLNGSINIFFYF